MENVLTGMLKEILDDPCLDEMAKRLDSQPIAIFPETDNDEAPGISYLSPELDPEERQRAEKYDSHIRELNVCDAKEFDRKMLFLDEDSVRFIESIVDNTMFNVIQEATHGECDLMKAPRTYISKKAA